MASAPRDKVFISYRFGEDAIFNDVTGIDPGAAFPTCELRAVVARAGREPGEMLRQF